jgi:nucleoside-diphosphate-sugar epimerase
MDRVIWAYGMKEGLDFTLFRPFNWIGAGLDNINAPKEGSSRVVTQFLGQIARGQDIMLVGGGEQRRTFTYIDDGVDCLLRIIRNKAGVASGKIYNVGNPRNNLSIRELAETLLRLAKNYPEYRSRARRVKLRSVKAEKYFGEGYQDIQFRVPAIANTRRELGWRPRVGMEAALDLILQAYKGELKSVRRLVI